MSMRSIYRGDVLNLEVYGESHSPTIGVLIEGLPEGVVPDEEKTAALMKRRAPGQNKWSTPRKEKDEVIFETSPDGRLHGYIVNSNTKPKDYASIMNKPRPSHADFTAKIKYGDKASKSGGGIFSGRMTAPLCIAGSIAIQQLEKRGIRIFSHVKSIAGIPDDSYFDHAPLDEGFKSSLSSVSSKEFPVISDASGEKMKEKIEEARMSLDSVGGIIETVVYGMPAGVGGPIFDGLEGKIAQIIYAVPAVKGIEFGNGFGAALLKGSENNDPFTYDGDKVTLASNRSGGILGGISVGGECAPIVFDCCLKPTPSIGREQKTVDIENKEDTTLEISGRHDPCIVPRAVPVIEAASAIAIYDRILAEERGM